MKIIEDLRAENSDLKNRSAKMETDISKLTSQIQQTNVSFETNFQES